MSVEDAAQIFLSTPSARRATAQTKLDIAKQAQFLSTPSARRATPFPAGCSGGKKISIHALREEGDTLLSKILPRLSIFLSTPSARRATATSCWAAARPEKFLSTPSARRATRRKSPPDSGHQISIHALREEGDKFLHSITLQAPYFYPRPPRGGRRITVWMAGVIAPFLSTPSARRATRWYHQP